MTDHEIETKVTSFLDTTTFSYEVINIDPEFADTVMFCEKYGFPLENSANTIIVSSKKKPKIFWHPLFVIFSFYFHRKQSFLYFFYI